MKELHQQEVEVEEHSIKKKLLFKLIVIWHWSKPIGLDQYFGLISINIWL